MELQVTLSRNPPIYFAEQNVDGYVVINASETYKCRQVLIKILGLAKNRWSVSKSGTGTSSTSCTFDAQITVISEEIRVWGECVGKDEIPIGQLQFPFSFKLPTKCLPSLNESYYGKIIYSVAVEVDTGRWKFNKTANQEFTIPIVTDIRLNPRLHEPTIGQTNEKIGLPLFRKGEVGVEAAVPRLGWAPGEIMDLEMTIDNRSSRLVDGLSLEMERIIDFRAFEFGKKVFTVDEPFHEEGWMDNRRSSRSTVREKKMTIEVAPETKATLRLPFEIANAVPSFESAITRLHYNLKVSVCSGKTLNSTVSCLVPLVIGSIGFGTQDMTNGFVEPPPTYKEALKE